MNARTSTLRRGGVLASFLYGTLILAVFASSAAQSPATSAADYERLLEGRFQGPVDLAEPLEWRLDTARFELRSGKLWRMEPAADGSVTGIVFEGDGRLEMTVPHSVERRQLARFAEDEEVDRLEESFDRLVLRSSFVDELIPAEILSSAAASSAQTLPLANERHREWRRWHFEDPDARTLAALVNEGARYLIADVSTERFGWLTYSWDSARAEEIEVSNFRSGRSFLESWLALDERAERTEEGDPGAPDPSRLELIEFTAKIDVTETGKGGARGVGAVNPVDGRFETTVRLRARRPVSALVLELDPLAEVDRAWLAGSGEDLDFFRYPIGTTDSALPKRLHHRSLVVLLDRELASGEEVEVGFDYRLELPGYASLLDWYPRPLGMGLVRHGMRLEITHRDDYAVKAVGTEIERREEGKQVVSVWEAESPVDGVGFTIARAPYEKSYEYEGLPEVIMFGTQIGYMSAEKIEGFAPDIINAINYFQQLYDSPIRTPRFVVSFIASGHGQAMEGFLHISDAIAQARGQGRASAGSREWFLAHEVAHEWWGHQVGWTSYRDQWLSEGFASYGAAMFVEASLDNGPKLFEQIIDSYTNELHGSLGSAFGAFSRPGLALGNRAGDDRMGPIGLGLRARTVEAPGAYQSMAYTKGALVLHMLRSILRTITKSDETFVTILRDFIATHQGSTASTADFEAVLTKHAPSDWSWFFDQWVNGTAIPTYRVKEVGRPGDGGSWILELDVVQEDVPPGFKSPVPVRAEFGGGRMGELIVMVDKPENHFELTLPEKPKKVIFNPGHAILARVRK